MAEKKKKIIAKKVEKVAKKPNKAVKKAAPKKNPAKKGVPVKFSTTPTLPPRIQRKINAFPEDIQKLIQSIGTKI